jgi:hypothetical protein
MLLSGKKIRKSAILSLLALILLSGSGLNQFLIENIQGVESAEELIESEIEIEATFETKRNVERKTKGESFVSPPYLANVLASSSISCKHPAKILAPISKIILHRSFLI